MKIVCSWCKKFIGEKEPFDDPSESHAKCSACVEKQRYEQELKKKEESRIVDIDGFPGYLTIAGKESPKVSFWEIDFSGKQFFCCKQTRKEFEKHIASLPGDEVNVTWLHSSVVHFDDSKRGRGRKKKIEEPPKDQPKKENYDRNCTVRVSKAQALQIFESAIEKNTTLAGGLLDIAQDWAKKERIWVDEEIFLFPPMESDVPNIVKYLRDKEIYDRTIMIPYPYTEEDGKKFVKFAWDRVGEFRRTMEWGIFHIKDKLIGVIGFHGKSKESLELEEVGFWLGKPYWNRGIMTKVLKKVTDHAFEKYKFKRIEMNIFTFNDVSCRVAEKCGYKFEKLVPGKHQKDGKQIDAKLYALEKN